MSENAENEKFIFTHARNYNNVEEDVLHIKDNHVNITLNDGRLFIEVLTPDGEFYKFNYQVTSNRPQNYRVTNDSV